MSDRKSRQRILPRHLMRSEFSGSVILRPGCQAIGRQRRTLPEAISAPYGCVLDAGELSAFAVFYR